MQGEEVDSKGEKGVQGEKRKGKEREGATGCTPSRGKVGNASFTRGDMQLGCESIAKPLRTECKTIAREWKLRPKRAKMFVERAEVRRINEASTK